MDEGSVSGCRQLDVGCTRSDVRFTLRHQASGSASVHAHHTVLGVRCELLVTESCAAKGDLCDRVTGRMENPAQPPEGHNPNEATRPLEAARDERIDRESKRQRLCSDAGLTSATLQGDAEGANVPVRNQRGWWQPQSLLQS